MPDKKKQQSSEETEPNQSESNLDYTEEGEEFYSEVRRTDKNKDNDYLWSDQNEEEDK